MMKPVLSSKGSSRMSIEAFDAKLLKELNLFNNDEFINDEEDIDNDSKGIGFGFTELSFDEFEKTL